MRQYSYLFLLLLFASCKENPNVFDSLSAFYKPVTEPVLSHDSSAVFFDSLKNEIVRWKRADVFNPAAIVRNDTVFVLSRCEDNPAAILGGRTSRIGLSASTDGINFSSFPSPVLYPAKDSFQKYDFPGGCEDPRIVQTEDSLYVMAYTSWNYKIPRLSIAFSRDLFHWVKKGPAFEKAYHQKFLDTASKSASMITKMEGDKIVLAKIAGKYWMYWGERFVNLAWSENLYDWNPVLDSDGHLKHAMDTRPHYFDSDLDECGPPALVTNRGVMLIYNGKNATDSTKSDPMLPKGTYSTGRVFFDPKNLQTILIRSDDPFLKPTLPYEVSGQYTAGTTFAEGLVYFRGKWLLYYGTADSFVGVAISK